MALLVRITKTIGLNNDTMYNIFMNQDKINYIISNFNDYRCQDLANYLNEPYQAVRYQIRKLKLHKTKHQLVRTKSSFNNHYFDKLNKDNSYFLGLIWADGHIKKFTENSYQFEIGLVDEDLIKSFAKELNTKYSV
jgi:DNA-binding transcriptional regulator WhiA